MNANFWYVSRSTEIFIDTDNYTRSMRHTAARLLGAIKCNRLNVRDIEYHESKSNDHLHTIIHLENPMMAIERYTWALILHSDIYRAASNIMRELSDCPAPDVLITPISFSRAADDVCFCDEKHKAEVMLLCPAAARLRGPDRTRGFFGKSDNSARDLQDVLAHIRAK